MQQLLHITAAIVLCTAIPPPAAAAPQATHAPFAALDHEYVLIGLGDSLTQGTMDAADNSINTPHAYLQKLYDNLTPVLDIGLSQPLLDLAGKRIAPFVVPTNLGIDGSDVFTIDGLAYYKRRGASGNRRSLRHLCNGLAPWRLRDIYDNTLYPYNLLCGGPASQLDSAAWLLNSLQRRNAGRGIIILWIGNNDSSSAALGYGTRNPVYVPLPYSIIENRLKPGIAAVLDWAQARNLISFEPYTDASIDRNLTDAADFAAQFEQVLARLEAAVPELYDRNEIFVCTLPYYSSVGYLFDADDLEFYLGQLDPAYRVPPSFARASPPGEPITDFTRGDRVNLITFLCMYGLLATGADTAGVNRVLETDGVQNDGLVLSHDEQAFIRSRIDEFNGAIRQAVLKRSGGMHLIETGPWLNQILTGAEPFTIGDRRITRKWVRGSSFTLDGVHPGYTGQAVIANKITESVNAALGLAAQPADLAAVMASDPYIDHDGDGWAPGPDYEAQGMTGILFLFRDPDDGDPAATPALPADIWGLLSDAILKLL